MLQNVNNVALCGRFEQSFNSPFFDFTQTPGNLVRGDYQFADEPLQVIDQRLLIGEECLNGDAVKIDGPLQAAKKCLCAGCQLLKPRGE